MYIQVGKKVNAYIKSNNEHKKQYNIYKSN